MARVTYIDPAGVEHTLEGDDGVSAMDLAVKNGVAGVVAECGGFMNCASCHVYVDEQWLAEVGLAGEDEGDMLDGAMSPRLDNSRLSCQILLRPELDGLKLTVAPEQM